jgi:hypothetical protein
MADAAGFLAVFLRLTACFDCFVSFVFVCRSAAHHPAVARENADVAEMNSR